MNILININDFQTENIFFMENKENIIVNGIFVKILYSSEYYTMNGIYLHFPLMYYEKNNIPTNIQPSISFQNINMKKDKNVLFFDIEKNFELISQFSKLETTILQFYMKNKNIKNKNIVKNISTQLKNGAIRYYNYKFLNGLYVSKLNESNAIKSNNNDYISQIKHGLKKFYIKISGIWETNTDIGMTYKLIYY